MHTFINIMFGINILLILSIIFFERKNPSTTWAWILILTFIPVLGFIFYILFGQNITRERTFKRKIVSDKTKQKYLNSFKEEFNLEGASIKYKDLIMMNFNNDNSTYTKHNHIDLHFDANDLFNDMLRSISEAKDFIHMEFYIFKSDDIGEKFLDLLTKKAEEGVEVKLLVDSIGNSISNKHIEKFKAAGGEFKVFFPGLFKYINLRINYRNHRKILVVDKKVAFLGGFNIGDEYLGKDKNIGFWRDTHTKIQGLAINDLEGRFLLDWSYATESDLDIDVKKYFLLPNDSNIPNDITGAQIVSSGPDHVEQQIKNGYFKIINSAKKSLFIQTPYFVLDEPMLEALKLSALSGVDVKIMLPGNPDHAFMAWIANSYFEELINSGVKIYLYNNGFLHAKTIMSDSSICSIGTANMDIRSFSLNFESNIFIYDETITKKMENQFYKDMECCEKVELDKFRHRSRVSKIGESLIRLVSPLM
ncbi:cardiolipin synthase [Clostridium sp. B9]|uniref:cardiolipin synthase n=1 Tax=Clostridium sp. B9 TaxID=3423224 RepID=UPI003D2EFB4E